MRPLKTFPYLYGNELCFVDIRKRHEACGSETKDFILLALVIIRVSTLLIPVPRAQVLVGNMKSILCMYNGLHRVRCLNLLQRAFIIVVVVVVRILCGNHA